MPIPYCPSTAPARAKTIRSRMPLVVKHWSWMRPWLVPMPFWAATRWSSSGTSLEARLNIRRLLSSIRTMQRPTIGTPNDIGRIGGREQEALTEAELAHQLDPLSPITSMVEGGIYIWARGYDQAIVTCKRLANENPTFAPAHLCLATAYWGKRMYLQVIEEFRTYDQLSGDRNESEFSSALEKGFHSGGWKAAETNAIQTLRARRKTSYAPPFLIATLHADLGDNDQAFRWLNIAYQEHEWRLISLKTEFTFAPLRTDPRFAELIRKVGLPQ